jgi:hypothetical protein
MSLLLLHAACSCCMSLLNVHSKFLCYPSMLHARAACPCCMPMLHVFTVIPCCMSMLHVHQAFLCCTYVHDACPSCVSNAYAACPTVAACPYCMFRCNSPLHVHAARSCRMSTCPCFNMQHEHASCPCFTSAPHAHSMEMPQGHAELTCVRAACPFHAACHHATSYQSCPGSPVLTARLSSPVLAVLS